MKILIGSNVHWWNAEAAYAATLAELLVQAGHQVFVLTIAQSLNAQKLQEKGLRLVTHIDLNTQNPIRLLQSYRDLEVFLLQNQIEIVNPHRSEGFPLYVLLARKLHSFKIVRTRGSTRRVRKHWINRMLHQHGTDAHIVAGHIVAERLCSGVEIPSEKIHRIYYPISIPDLETLDSTSYFKEFQIPEGSCILSIVGRLSPVKGHALLLEAFAQLLQQFPHCFLLIAYRDATENSEDWIRLQEQLQRFNLHAQVRLIPPRSDIRHIMKFSDIGVVSSLDSEVICRVAVEFFSVGTPVVAFPSGCLPEIVQEGRNGKLTATHSVSALAEALAELVKNPSLCHNLGKNALQDAQERFDPEGFLQANLKVFESVL